MNNTEKAELTTILKDFYNQEYLFTIPKSLTQLAEKQEEEKEQK